MSFYSTSLAMIFALSSHVAFAAEDLMQNTEFVDQAKRTCQLYLTKGQSEVKEVMAKLSDDQKPKLDDCVKMKAKMSGECLKTFEKGMAAVGKPRRSRTLLKSTISHFSMPLAITRWT